MNDLLPRCTECGTRRDVNAEGDFCANCALELALVDGGATGDAPSEPNEVASAPALAGYEIRELLGQGGMGTVWLAEQREPVRRTVAVKIIRPGFDGDAVARRFEAEQQALALMDHPNVARLFGSGTTDDGRPCFVMEYVDGVPITAFCDLHRSSVDERVDLLAAVCEAVHHAHQRGIIHRDLKPSNILVLDRQGKAEPKVIDFGIAKATRPQVFDHTGVTRIDQLLGTPEYMSPEQMDHGDAGVDIRSDVYSLGAVLYELLTGVRPFDRATLSSSGLEGMLRTIRTVDPPTPSARVIAIDDGLERAARARSATPGALGRKLRGELDWITMKALAKDRNRRFPSAWDLAQDLRRFGRSEPVSAGPPGTRYRISKFVSRHRGGVLLAGVIATSLVVFSVGMALQTQRVTRERDRANEQAEISRQVKDFLVEIFRVSDPGESRGNSVTAREILERGSEKIREEVADPAVRAELIAEMGMVYKNLGLRREAESLLRESFQLHSRSFGSEDPRTLVAMTDLAGAVGSLGQSAAAESLFIEALEGWRNVVPGDDPRILDTRHDLALEYREQGRYQEAESLLVQVLADRRHTAGDDDARTITALSNLALVRKRMRKLDASEPLYLEALERRRRTLGEDHPRTLLTMSGLGDLYQMLGRHDEAVRVLAAVVEAQRRVLGPEHPDLLTSQEYLATTQCYRREYGLASEAYAEILGARRQTLGAEHPSTLISMHNLGSVYLLLDRYAESESILVETLAIRMRVLGERHPLTLGTRHSLLLGAARQGNREDALAQLQRMVEDGWSQPIVFQDDLANLQGDPEFEALAERVRLHLEN